MSEKSSYNVPASPGESPMPPLPPLPSTAESVGDIWEKFAVSVRPDDPEATIEDLKVLMTRAGKLLWPDGKKFTSKQGKAMIKALYKVESTKDLRRPQVDSLYNFFGEVLTGRAKLALDEKGIPYVVRVSSVNVDF